ncbi:MAG TPA: hypothetical protein DCZ72_00005, partial [Armatimonadetes bacterium]|nr:hypothetical protein [Armatimonadota bacterium]
PPLPVHLVGYSRERRTIEVADELAARALVLEADGQRVALLSAELLWLEHGQVETIRAQIAALCGLEPGAVMVACTHTHSGPDTLGWYDYAPLDEAWLATLLRQLAGCVWLACQRLRPVRAERVEGTLPVGICRRLRTENGMVIGQNPDGLYDDSAVGLRLLDEAGGLYASVVSAGVHPTSQGAEEPLVSADWPGVMCRLVERELGG